MLQLHLLGQVSNYSRLWWPAGTAVLCTGLAIWMFFLTREWVDRWLTTGRTKRGIMTVIFVLLSPILIALLVDWIDVSDAAKGQITISDTVLSCVLMVILVGSVWGQSILWWHTDKWDDRLLESNARRESDVAALRKELELADEKYRTADATLQFVLEANRTFLGVVDIKAQRVRQLIDEARQRGGPLNVGEVKGAMNPRTQIARLLTATFDVLWERRKLAGSKLRIAYFQLGDDGYFKPVHCWDGNSTECVKSVADRHKERFRVNAAADKCLAVLAAHRGELEIVENADAANADRRHAFKYFDDEQPKHLKSMVVFPLHREDSARPIRHIVCADTDEVGLFAEKDREELRLLGENLVRRLLFELEMEELLNFSIREETDHAVTG